MDRRQWLDILRLLGLGWYVVTAIGIGVAGGLLIDHWADTAPVLTLVGLALGILAAFLGYVPDGVPPAEEEYRPQGRPLVGLIRRPKVPSGPCPGHTISYYQSHHPPLPLPRHPDQAREPWQRAHPPRPSRRLQPHQHHPLFLGRSRRYLHSSLLRDPEAGHGAPGPAEPCRGRAILAARIGGVDSRSKKRPALLSPCRHHLHLHNYQ